jgi:tRNA (guanine26-N2/guanine27-N2)-dimethyltransferase
MFEEAGIKIKVNPPKIVSRQMEVFYNPLMKFNRDLTSSLIKILKPKKIGLPLAATGIRGIRFLSENKNILVKFNDRAIEAIKLIKSNLKLNKISKNFEIHNLDANLFLLTQGGFDFIDIDPFGSPNPFLDASIKAISRKGVIAVTATDTAPLAGAYPKTCKRKYWAIPQKSDSMHEIGIRILIRKCQLIASQYEKALTPIISYYKDHYYRVFFKCEKGKQKCDKLIKQHDFYQEAGPLWTGKLNEKPLLKKMIKISENKKFLQFLYDEINTVGIYNINQLGKTFHLKQIPKMEDLFSKIKKKGYKVSRTHITGEGFKSDISLSELKKIMK